MASVTVAVLTFLRPADLAELLPALADEVAAAAASTGAQIDVLVIDNDPAGSAEALVVDNGVRYVCEPVPGIAAARNRALDESRASDALVFIDDDERPRPGWLGNLVELWARTGCAAVAGQVESQFDGELDPWIEDGGFFRRTHTQALVTGTRVPAAATNNLLLDVHAVRRHGLEFDTSIGMAGGEDTLFTRRLVAAGESILWCAEAIVVDCVPAARMTRRFVVRRRFAQANVSIGVAVRLASGLREQVNVRGRFGVTSLARVVGGGLEAAAGTVVRRPSLQARGVARLARGLGGTSAVVGYRFQEYRRSSPATRTSPGPHEGADHLPTRIRGRERRAARRAG